MTTGYESIMFLLAWYSTSTTLFAAILSPAFLNDSITFFGTIGKGIVSLLQEFVTGADSFGQLSNRISNSIISWIVYWLIVAIVMGILFIMMGLPIVWIGYQVEKIYRKYCWDIISIMMAINEYSYCNLLRKMDKINHSDEPYSTVNSCARSLYRNPMLCERLVGGTRILLKQKENRKIF